jgi:hypothetical protein
MKYINKLNIDFDNWNDMDEKDPVLNLYKSSFLCIKTYNQKISIGNTYKIDSIYGDIESSYNNGHKYLNIENLFFIKIKNKLFSYKKNSKYPLFSDYFLKIKKPLI